MPCALSLGALKNHGEHGVLAIRVVPAPDGQYGFLERRQCIGMRTFYPFSEPRPCAATSHLLKTQNYVHTRLLQRNVDHRHTKLICRRLQAVTPRLFGAVERRICLSYQIFRDELP